MAVKGYDQAPASLRTAISDAARVTGVPEDYLVRLAAKESTFNIYAVPPVDKKTGRRASSAQGAFQFLDDTWNGTTKKYGARYGVSGETSRFDPRASAFMAAELARENQGVLQKALGRAPTSGELYMAHFLGSSGASNFLTQMRANPQGFAADTFKDQAAANPSIFYADPKTRIRRENYETVYKKLTQSFEGGWGAEPSSVPGQPNMPNIYGAEPLPEEPKFSVAEMFGMAASQEQSQVLAAQYLMRLGNPDLAPDESFKWTPQLIQEATADLPEDHARWVVENAQSQAQIDYYRRKAQDDLHNEETLGQQGWLANLGLRGAAVLTDLPSWLVGAGAGKLAQGARAGRAVMAARAGLVAVAESVPGEFAKAELRPDYGVDDALISGTTAFAFGAGFGAAFGHPGQDLDKVFVREAARSEREGLERAGETLTPSGRQYYSDLEGKSVGAAATPKALTGVEGDKSLIRKLDISVVGRLKRMDNPEVRALADQLDIDAIGDGGASLRPDESAYEYMRRTGQSADAAVKRTHEDAFEAWAADKGLPIQKKIGSGRDAFDEEVAREIIQPTGRDPNISRAADAHRTGYADWLARAKKEGAEWAANVPKDPNYFPIMFDRGKLRAMIARFDDDGVASVVRQAIVKMSPAIDRKLAARVSEKYVKVIRDVTEGTQGTVAHAIAGLDNAALKDLLENAGLAADDASAFVDSYKPIQKRGPANFRRRTILDDTSKFVPDGAKPDDAFSIRDLTDMHATRVWERYNRSMSGNVAMVRAGFQTRGAFQKHIVDITKGQANWEKGFTDTHAQTALDDLKYLGDHIYGIPIEDVSANTARLVGIFGDFNFARAMGQSGVAQLGDVPKIFLRTSMAAAWQTFRMSDIARVFRRGGKEADDLAKDLEVMTGVGTMRARSTIIPMYKEIEEFYPESLSTVALDRVRRSTKTAANVTALVGGMTPATDFLGRWSVRASLQHVADLTRGASKASDKVLNDMGLGAADMVRFKALVDQMELTPNGTVKDLRLAKLKAFDAEGVDKLAAFLSRQSRMTILEHSPGMLPRFAGSTVGRVLLQFRTFSFASHAANTLHNIRMGNAYAAQSMMATGLWSAAVYALHQYTKSVGREDQQEYLDRVFDPVKFSASAFGRSADSGIIPMIADTVLMPVYAATGAESPFQYSRTSGLAAGLQGIPAVDLALTLEGSTREGIADLFREDKRATKEDMKRLQRLVPLNNTYGIANAFQAITGLFPDDEPYEDGGYGN